MLAWVTKYKSFLGGDMSIKDIVVKQYIEIVDKAQVKISGIYRPAEGWLRTTRKALGVPPRIIYERLGITKSEYFRRERAELEGTLTLQNLKQAAQAMNCELHYAIVPCASVDEVVKNQANKHASKLIKDARVHMELEDQATSMEQIEFQFEKITKQLINERPKWFWEDRDVHQ